MKKHNSWERILDALTEPMTYHRVAGLVHLHPRTVARLLRDMLQERFIHIVGWEHYSAQGPMAAVYMRGNGRSVPRPKAMTGAEIARKRRANMDQNKRQAVLIKRRKAKPDIAASWIPRM